ncbi:aminotransferase class V-fold PLP-dependent enzyme [Cryobacterium sp. TMT1-2-2]|nr:aminotransferase class V-fold PLP-dependent enzyme [Cryobacterium sp. TMT1-2-2]
MVHLASCSQGALSTQLNSSLSDLTGSLTDSGAPWGLWMGEVEKLRERFARFINASTDEIAIVSSASEGAYQVASSFSWDRRPGILTSALEFPSVGHVWRAQAAQGAQVHMISDRVQALDVLEWDSAINESLSLVSAPLVSYHDGARPPLRELTDLAHEAGARMFVDAYQGAGVVPIDVKELDCDYLVTGSLKYMLGLAGVAFLYVKDGITSERSPELTGWFGRVDPFAFDPELVDYPTTARRFECGTPAVPAVYAANAGLGVLERVDQAVGYEHIMRLSEQLATGLSDLGIRMSRPADPKHRGPQVAIFDEDPAGLSEWLFERGIMTAPRGRLLRLSLHYYTTAEDIETALAALRQHQSRR